MCLKESLRLFPSVQVIGRTLLADLNVNDHVIPKGTDVMMVPYVLHRLPQFWDSPDEFDPERFSKEKGGNRHPFAFVPFSAGCT